MCEPTTITAGMLALSAASSAAQVSQQRRNAEKQNKAIANNYAIQSSQLQVQQEQQNKAVAAQQAQIAERARAQRASIATMGGESGALGNYLTRALAESQFAEGNAGTNLEINRENTMLAGFNQGNAMAANANMSMERKQSYSTVLLDTALKGMQVYKSDISDALFPKAKPKMPSLFGSDSVGYVPKVSPSYLDPDSLGLTQSNQSNAPWRYQ